MLLWACAISLQATAQEVDSLPAQREKSLLAVPIAFFSPETSLGLGAAGLLAFRLPGEPETGLTSQVQLGFAYTLLDQVLLYLPYRIFWGGQKNIAFGELGYYRYVYRYFGIGNASPAIDEWYDADFPRLRFNYLRALVPGFFAGWTVYYDDLKIVGKEAGGALENPQVPGYLGGKVAGTGPIFIYDTRDRLFFPTKGAYLETAWWLFSTSIGSDFNFQKWYMDFSYFLPVGKDYILAFNTFHEWNTGDVPFYEMALMGGNKRMRGYFEGRFRDKAYSTLQTELRAPLFWRLGWTAFAGLGVVDENPFLYQGANLKGSYGLGLRMLLDKKEHINIRVDYGRGSNSSGFYLTVTEAF